MSDPDILHLITHAKTLIMRQEGWDEGIPLSNEQAIELSRKMEAKTSHPINSRELLKFWNAVPKHAFSHTEILETLASFQEYANWEEFVATHQMRLGSGQNSLSTGLGSSSPTTLGVGQETLALLQKKNKQLRTIVWVLGVLNALLLAFLLYRIFGMEG